MASYSPVCPHFGVASTLYSRHVISTQNLWPRLLAWTLLPIPAVGWVVAQSFPDRILRNAEYTSALFHTNATSSFAVILFASALTNAIIVTVRSRYRPLSHRPSRYIAWQSVLLALSLGWLACVIAARVVIPELILGALVAVASIVVCVFAAKRDSEANRRRIELREARTPEVRRRIVRTRLLVPTAVLVMVIAAAVVVQNIEVVHRACAVNGWGSANGVASIYSENCGAFAVENIDLEQYSGRTLDITTRGYRLGLQPEPIVTSVVDR